MKAFLKYLNYHHHHHHHHHKIMMTISTKIDGNTIGSEDERAIFDILGGLTTGVKRSF
jgi:ribosomal protein S6E (S10)